MHLQINLEEKNVKFQKTKFPGAIHAHEKRHEDTLISLQFLFCRNPGPVALLFHIAEI